MSGLPPGGGLAPPSTGVGRDHSDWNGSIGLRSSRRVWSLTSATPISAAATPLMFSVLSSAFQYARRLRIGVTLSEPAVGLQSQNGV